VTKSLNTANPVSSRSYLASSRSLGVLIDLLGGAHGSSLGPLNQGSIVVCDLLSSLNFQLIGSGGSVAALVLNYLLYIDY